MKLEFEFPVLMLKSELFVNALHRTGRKFSKFLHFLGDVGIILGFFLMPVAVAILVKGFVSALKTGVSGVTIVIPGLALPGSPIKVPLISGLLAIFLIMLFHEGMHALMASAHKLKPSSFAFVLFAFIPAAGVELDEKKLEKLDKRAKLRIFGAGTLGNLILALLLFIIINPGAKIVSAHARIAGLEVVKSKNPEIKPGIIIRSINGINVSDVEKVRKLLDGLKKGEEVVINGNFRVKLVEDGKLGVYLKPRFEFSSKLFELLAKVLGFFFLTYNLSLGVGVINMAPLGILDGGRMLKELSKKGYRFMSSLTLFLLAGNLLLPVLIRFL